MVVVSDNWDAQTAWLRCYQRDKSGQAWHLAGDHIPVNIGRTGLAWGLGLHGEPWLPGPAKREGDGKAPAGIFELPNAFGYATQQDNAGIKLPYIHLTADVYGVDDVKSRHYNRIVRLERASDKDWDSAEVMLREDGLYELGVVVNHNTPPQAGAGSCIFLHIWRGQGKPTAGCTAMSREHMAKLVTWLDPQCKPVLVQLPQEAYTRLAFQLGLPPSPSDRTP